MSATNNHSFLTGAAPKTGLLSIGGRSYWRGIRLSIALMAIAFAYFYRLDRPLLWGDEAATGVTARNTLRKGYPVTYDGRNVCGSLYEFSSQLNRNLTLKGIPWAQYYVGAVSLAIFGNNTAGLRTLFAFVGLLAFFPICKILKTRVKYPEFVAVLVLISPQIVLFQRNARYFSILILLYAVLVRQLTTDSIKGKTGFLVNSLLLALLFHTHPFSAMCCCVSLVIFCLVSRRTALFTAICSAGIGFLSWFVWYKLLGPPLGTSDIFPFSLLASDFRSWLKYFWAGIWVTLVDVDAVDCIPFGLWISLAAFLLLRGREAILNALRDPLISFVLLNLVIQTFATAATVGYETLDRYALIRYMPHLLVFGMMSCFVVLNSVIRAGGLYVLACFFAVMFNFLTFSFWLKPCSRIVPCSWAIPVYSEMCRPKPNVWDAIIARVSNESGSAPDRDIRIVVLPPWTQEIMIFYLGDSYLIPPVLTDSTGTVEQAIGRALGDEQFHRLFAAPEWIVDTSEATTAPDTYAPVAVIPSYQAEADDGTRPELTRHTFPQRAVVGHVTLFRLQNNRIPPQTNP